MVYIKQEHYEKEIPRTIKALLKAWLAASNFGNSNSISQYPGRPNAIELLFNFKAQVCYAAEGQVAYLCKLREYNKEIFKQDISHNSF